MEESKPQAHVEDGEALEAGGGPGGEAAMVMPQGAWGGDSNISDISWSPELGSQFRKLTGWVAALLVRQSEEQDRGVT